MRPTTFDASVLRQHLLRHKIAELPETQARACTPTAVTVIPQAEATRLPRQLYASRALLYAAAMARFDDRGLWSHEAVWFSRYGTLLSTVEAFVRGSSNGYYAHELADVLHAEVQEPLRHLLQQGRLSRSEVDGQFCLHGNRFRPIVATKSWLAVVLSRAFGGSFGSPPSLPRRTQGRDCPVLWTARRTATPLVCWLGVHPRGHGGDTLLGDFLGLDAHTLLVAGNNCSTRMWSALGRAAKAEAACPRKKKRHA